MKRLRALTVVVVALATFAVAAPIALAGGWALPGATGSCNTGDFCLWRHDSAGGSVADTPYAENNYNPYAYWGTSHDLNDSASSVKNLFTTYDVRLYEHNTYTGYSDCFAKNSATLWNLGSAIEDESSSHKGVGGC